METTKGTVGIFYIYMIFMLMNGLATHVIVNPMILEVAGRDAWLSVLMAAVLYLPWCALLALFIRRSGQRKLQPWLAGRTSPLLSWLLLAPLYIELFIIGAETVLHTTTFVQVNYLPETPMWFVAATLIIISLYCASSGIRTIAVTAGILLPIVILLGYFVSFSNMPEKDYSLLMPVLEHGWGPPIRGMLYAGSGLAELIFILGLQHRMKRKLRVWHMLLFGLLMLYIMLGPIIGGITEFGIVEAAKQQESPYEQWRLVKLGMIIEHVDFLSEFQWLAGALIRVCMVLYLIGDLFSFKNKWARTVLLASLSLSYIIMLFIPIDKYSMYEWTMNRYIPGSLVVTLGISLILVMIALITKRTGGDTA